MTHRPLTYSVMAGFTLIELVMVMILVGVTAALGVGLFTGRSAFSPLLAAQQLASATTLAQQAALAGNPANTLTIAETNDVFRFTVGAATGHPRVFEIAREGASLAVAGGLPHTLTFNPSGAPAGGGNTQFTVSGQSNYPICLSSLGAVYPGTCQP